jgi:hypothetical protein
MRSFSYGGTPFYCMGLSYLMGRGISTVSVAQEREKDYNFKGGFPIAPFGSPSDFGAYISKMGIIWRGAFR